MPPRSQILPFTLAEGWTPYYVDQQRWRRSGKDAAKSEPRRCQTASFIDLPVKPRLIVLRTFGVNTLAHFWTLKAFLPGMIEQKTGHIVCSFTLHIQLYLLRAAGLRQLYYRHDRSGSNV